MKHHHPDIELDWYVDLFWYAEGYYNATDKQLGPYKDEQFQEMKTYLCQRHLVYPNGMTTYYNLYHLHFTFRRQKMGI